MSLPFEIPNGFTELLQEFTVCVLRERPADLIDYAAIYFNKKRADKRADNQALPSSGTFGSGASSGGMKWNVSRGEDNSESDSSIISDIPMLPTSLRRKSVAAESFDPEEEDSDEDSTPCYPKTDVQRVTLSKVIKNIMLFRCVDEDHIDDLINAMFEKKVVPGDVIIKQGEDGDNFYVIEKGTYEIFVDVDGMNKKVGEYNDSGSFGELALMYNTPRAATIKATTDGIIWAMDRKTFKNIVVKKAFKKRQMYENLLEMVPMLKELTTFERMNVADALCAKKFADGEVIIRQGDRGTDMFFIEEGVVCVKRKEGNTEKELVHLGKGAYFGELALVTNQPRAASVYAEGPTKIASLDVTSFERLLGPCMEIMKRNIDSYKKQVSSMFNSHT